MATLVDNLYVAVRAIMLLARQFQIKLTYYPEIVGSLLRLGILFSMSFFVLQLNYKIDILLLERLSSIEEVGLYSLATQIAEQLWQIPLAVSLVLFTRTANSEGRSTPAHVLPLTRITLLLVLVIALGLFVVAPYVIPMFFGKAFSASSLMLQIILPGIVVMSVFRVLSGQLAGLGKPQVTLYIFVPALIINVLLNFLWIPDYGGNGAAMASNVSYFLGVVGYWLYYSRLHKIPVVEIVRFRKSDFKALTQLIQKAKTKWTT